MMKLIYIASPYAGDIAYNTKMAAEYCCYTANCGMVPIAPHLLFPQFLSDSNPAEREQAIKMGLRLLASCNELWVFGGCISDGMRGEIAEAERLGMKIVYMDWSEEMCIFTQTI